MITERIALLLLLGGCASSSLESDVARVRELTRVEIDLAPPTEIGPLLAAPLDADRAVQIALLNNRELRAEMHSIGIERGELVQAGLIPNPVFEVEALPERDTQVELRIEYDVTSLLLAPIRSAAAEKDLEARRHQIASAVLELGHRVRTAFYMLQASEQRLAIAQRTLDAFAAARDAASALLEAGNLPAVEALVPITEFEHARVMVAEIELEVAGSRERVHRLLGLYGEETTWRSTGGLPALPEKLELPDRLETKAVEASLDLAAMKLRLEALAHRTSASRTEGLLPGIEVDVHGLYGHPEDQEPNDPALWRFGAGVSLGLPLFDRMQGTTLSHESEFDAEAERLQSLAIELRSAVREARGRVMSAHARAMQFQRKILPAQKRVVDQTLLQYNAMQLGVFHLLEAHREALELELESVDTLGEYWRAKASLDTLLAGRLVMMGGE